MDNQSSELVIIVLYRASPNRVIVLLKKLQDQQLFHVDFIPVQNGFCWPFFLRAEEMFYAGFIADHIRYSRCIN